MKKIETLVARQQPRPRNSENVFPESHDFLVSRPGCVQEDPSMIISCQNRAPSVGCELRVPRSYRKRWLCASSLRLKSRGDSRERTPGGRFPPEGNDSPRDETRYPSMRKLLERRHPPLRFPRGKEETPASRWMPWRRRPTPQLRGTNNRDQNRRAGTDQKLAFPPHPADHRSSTCCRPHCLPLASRQDRTRSPTQPPPAPNRRRDRRTSLRL